MALETGYTDISAYLDLNERIKRLRTILRFRRAHEAHRDTKLVFRAAAEGRPLELQRRLVLGRLAGGKDRLGEVGVMMMTPLDAASSRGHDECVLQLECQGQNNTQ